MRPPGLRSSNCSKLVFGYVTVFIATHLSDFRGLRPQPVRMHEYQQSQKRRHIPTGDSGLSRLECMSTNNHRKDGIFLHNPATADRSNKPPVHDRSFIPPAGDRCYYESPDESSSQELRSPEIYSSGTPTKNIPKGL